MDESTHQIKQDIAGFLQATAPYAEDPPPRRPRKRRRGGQPGNQNARTHGFYAKHLTPEEQDALLEASHARHLEEELALLRVKVRALINAPNPDVDLILRAMWVLARTARIDDRLRYGT